MKWPNLFGRASARAEQKSSEVGYLISQMYTLGQPVYPSDDFAAIAETAYVRNAVGFYCINLIAQSAADVPFLIRRNGKEVENHPIAKLMKRPNPRTSQRLFMESTVSYFLISGQYYVEQVGPIRGAPRELYSHRPDRIEAVPGAYGLPSAYRYTVAGQERDWFVDQIDGTGPIIHGRAFHPLDDLYGLARGVPAKKPLEQLDAITDYSVALIQNSATPSGVLSFPPTVTPGGLPDKIPEAALEKIEKQLLERHAGPKNAGRPLLIGGNAQWAQMGVSPSEMAHSEAHQQAARETMIVYGVPPFFALPGDSTYNNMAEANLGFHEKTVLPILGNVLDELSVALSHSFGDEITLEVDEDNVLALEPRYDTRRKSTIDLVQAKILTPNEGRERLGYDPLPEDHVDEIDAPTLAALVAAVETVGTEPLHRYLQSVGLVAPGSSPEKLARAALALLEAPEDEEEPDDETASE